MLYRYFNITVKKYQKIKLVDIILVCRQQWVGPGTSQ